MSIIYKIEYERKIYSINYSGTENIIEELESQGMDPMMAYRYFEFISEDFINKRMETNESQKIIDQVKNILKRKD